MGHRRSTAEARDPSGPRPSERVFGYFLRVEKVPRRRRNIYTHPPPNFGIGGFAPYDPYPFLGGRNGALSPVAPGDWGVVPSRIGWSLAETPTAVSPEGE